VGRLLPGAEALLSTPARLTLALTMLYVAGTLAIFFFLNHQLRVVLVTQVDKTLLEQKARLTSQYKEASLLALLSAIRAELQYRGQSDRTYRVVDAKGKKILEVGDLQLPAMLPQGRGISEIETRVLSAEGRPAKARYLRFSIADQVKVEIARSMETTEEQMAGFRKAFMVAMALILSLGLAGGWLLAKRFWNQIEDFNQMAMKIFNSGNLRERMPVKGNDEFSVLAHNMNAILDKMEKLFQGVRQVSDNIAHDLRSPLARLRVDVEVTLQESNPQNYRMTLDRVLTELQNMQDIFQSLLSLGQAEAGSMKIRKKPINLSQLLEDIVELYGPLAEDKGQTFEAHIPPDLMIEGDRQLLAQALSNLLDNAVKYVPEGGIITLSAEIKNDKAEVHIDDSGPGIPHEMRKKVFDRFVRVDPSRTLPGTGLGLSLVKAFIELHQGSITLSESKLGGTLFTILLPVK
jgi:signal transduction histidine kinase